MQQSARVQAPWVLNEQAIKKAKRRRHEGSNMTGHNSNRIWALSLPKLRQVGNECREANTSKARQFKTCGQHRDIRHGTASGRQICCKAQLVLQCSAQASKAGMMPHWCWQRAERKADVPVGATFGGMPMIQTARGLELRQTRRPSASRNGAR